MDAKAFGKELWNKILEEINDHNNWIFSEELRMGGETYDYYVKNLYLLNVLFPGLRFFVVKGVKPSADKVNPDPMIKRIYVGVSDVSDEQNFVFQFRTAGCSFPYVDSLTVDNSTQALWGVRDLFELNAESLTQGIYFPWTTIGQLTMPLANGLHKLIQLGVSPTSVSGTSSSVGSDSGIHNLTQNSERIDSTDNEVSRSASNSASGCCVFLVLPILTLLFGVFHNYIY